MKGLNRNAQTLGLCIVFIVTYGCLSIPPDKFIGQDFMMVRPFTKRDTVVFTSTQGQIDTIVFFPSEVDTGQIKSFELGFYNYYGMGVGYDLTQVSYHVVTLPKEDQPLYTLRSKLYGVLTASIKEYNARGLIFLNLNFDDSFIKTLPVDTAKIIDFKAGDSNKLNKTIFSFKFSPRVGIISYIDTGGVEWSRSKEW